MYDSVSESDYSSGSLHSEYDGDHLSDTFHLPVSIQLTYRAFRGERTWSFYDGLIFHPSLTFIKDIRCFSPYATFIKWMHPWDNREKRESLEDFMKAKELKRLKGMSKTEGIAHKC